MIVFYADAFQQGICPETRLESNESLQTTPFDDFIYLSTAKILMKFTFIADLPEGCDLPYPAPCPPPRFSYISRPDLLGTAEMDRKEREDSMLSQLIIDRQLWNTHKQVAGSEFSPPPPEDEFSESLDRLTKKGVLSAAIVFEVRIYLDIQDIMGDDVGRGHQDLLRNTKMIDKTMNLKVIDGAWDVVVLASVGMRGMWTWPCVSSRRQYIGFSRPRQTHSPNSRHFILQHTLGKRERYFRLQGLVPRDKIALHGGQSILPNDPRPKIRYIPKQCPLRTRSSAACQ